jgi:hypothetical protein
LMGELNGTLAELLRVGSRHEGILTRYLGSECLKQLRLTLTTKDEKAAEARCRVGFQNPVTPVELRF